MGVHSIGTVGGIHFHWRSTWWSIGWSVVGRLCAVHFCTFTSRVSHVNAHEAKRQKVCIHPESGRGTQRQSHGGGGGGGGGNRHRGQGGARAQTINQVRTTSELRRSRRCSFLFFFIIIFYIHNSLNIIALPQFILLKRLLSLSPFFRL